MINELKAAGFTNIMLQVTGESDTGKTTFALECGAKPEEIVFIDADIKGRATVEQIKKQGFDFAFYRDVVADIKGMREIEHHDYCLRLLDTIKELDPANRRVIVWDTWEPFEKTLKPVVTKDPKRFREFYSSRGDIKGAEQWLSSFDYEAEIINRILGMCDLFIAVNHVKNANIAGQRVEGKVVADCKRPVVQKSLSRIWLKHNPESAVPIGLVMKRLGRKKFVKGKGIRTVNILPRKITPRAEDESLWDTIRYYWENPIGKRKPELHETPDAFELSILENTLTEDQRMVLQLAIQNGKASDDLFGPIRNEQVVKLYQEKLEEGMKKAKARRAVGEELEVSVPEVLKILRESEE